MGDVRGHYEELLAEHYTWMLGDDIEATATAQRDLLERIGISGPAEHQAAGSVAVDVGCGSGAQTLALADLGFASVLGIDTDASLLHELRRHAAGRPAVRTQHEDGIEALEQLGPESVDLVVCMGDTILHLPTAGDVGRFAVAAARALRPCGTLALTYRDLTTALHGSDRFIPVRSTEDQIMVCFLDFAHGKVAVVNDIIHTRTDSGWEMHTSSYPKLRLDPASGADALAGAGLRDVQHHQQQPSGLWATVARR